MEKIVSAELYDPEDGTRGFVSVKDKNDGKEIRLQIQPGKSLFLFTYQTRIQGNHWKYSHPADKDLILD